MEKKKFERKHERLQEEKWDEVKEGAKLLYTYPPSEKGNIKGVYKLVDGRKVSHWLNDKEREEYLERSKSWNKKEQEKN